MLEPVFPFLAVDGWRLSVQAVFLAFALDLLFGDPKFLYGRIAHPIVWIGGLISALEGRLRSPGQSQTMQIALGAILATIIIAISAFAGLAIAWAGALTDYGWIVTGVIGSIFIAGRGLHDHVADVGLGLSQSLNAGRMSVSLIVGRDPESLDESGVSRAALESLAENFSDGVVAPLFWFLLGGLPGLLAYKAVNTLDSMIGHRDAGYLYFGRFAARLDDVVNWPASRIAAMLLCTGALLTPAASGSGGWRVMWRDAGKHGSPNAGWPEAALAGALALALAGPRHYGETVTAGAWMGDGGSQANAADIARGCALFRWTCGVIAVALGMAVLA
jgi:adenosylcobinamide-phosphate synthase